MAKRTGRRHTRRTHPVSGQILFRGSGGELPSGMENPFPLKRTTVHLVKPTGEPIETVSDDRGRFAFSREELEGLDLTACALQVFAHSPRGLSVCNGGVETKWSFFVPGPAHDMSVEVPGSEDFQEVLLFSSWPRPAVTSHYEPHYTREAFRAYAALSQMRSWLWGSGGRESESFPWLRRADVIYPSTSSWYWENVVYLGARMYRFDEDDQVVPAGRSRAQYSLSSLAHEFGHHVVSCAGPLARSPGGQHGWEEDLPSLPSDASEGQRAAVRRRLALDFSEGYATFVGQCFLADRSYRYEHGESYDLETPRYGCEAGDWPTAGYLWDLVDGLHTTDQVDLSFEDVHREFALFAAEEGSSELYLPAFHDFLKRSPRLREVDAGIADKLDRLLAQNHLEPSYEAWQRLSWKRH